MNCLQKPLSEHSSLYSNMPPTQDSRWYVSSQHSFLLFLFQAVGHTKDNMLYFFFPSTFSSSQGSIAVAVPGNLRSTAQMYPTSLPFTESPAIFPHSSLGDHLTWIWGREAPSMTMATWERRLSSWTRTSPKTSFSLSNLNSAHFFIYWGQFREGALWGSTYHQQVSNLALDLSHSSGTTGNTPLYILLYQCRIM